MQNHIYAPILYIEWKEDDKPCCFGPFYTISPDGSGQSINQGWMAYQVQTADFEFKRIIIPTKYHTIVAKR